MSYLAKAKAADKYPDSALLSEWEYKYHERLGLIAEDNNLAPYANRLAFLETLVEYLQTHHAGIVGQFKGLVKPVAVH